MRLIVTRPEEDAGPLKARLEALGHHVISAPLLKIVARDGVSLLDRPYQAIAITSANGIRTLKANHHLKSVRMLTVGPQSLQAANRAGFRHAEAQGGDVAGLADFIGANLRPKTGPILYLSGAETTGDLQARLAALGFDVDRVTLYDAVPADDLGAAAQALRRSEADAVLLYSPRTARIWVGLAEGTGLVADAKRPHYLCLSENVAAILPETWKKSIAETPEDSAMMALLEQIQRTR